MLRLLPRAALLCAALITSATAAPVTVSLTGNNGAGALNLPGFDNENTEPSGPGDSFGYAYFFNETNGLWSILPSSPTTASAAYYQSVLSRSGITNYSNLTLSGVTANPNAALVNFGSVSYEGSLVTGIGTEVLAPGQFTLQPSSSDFVLDPYYGSFNNFAFSVGDVTGTGITLVNGVITSLDFVAQVAILSNPPFAVQWDGTLTFSGLNFQYNINEDVALPGLGANLRLLLDRSGTITSVPEPSTVLLLTAAAVGLALVATRRRRATC